jgi:hypothetical protein
VRTLRLEKSIDRNRPGSLRVTDYRGIAGIVAIALFAAALFPSPAGAGDGLVLKTFSSANGLPGDWLKGVFRDGDRVVATTMAGSAVFDPAEGNFVPFAPGKGFRGSRVTGWAEFGGKTYVGTEAALNVRENGTWSSLDRQQQVLHNEELLYADPKALYGVARVMFGGVLRFDGKEWKIVDRGPGTGIMNNATSIATRGDEIFIGTTTNGLFHFDGKEWKVFGPEQGLPGVWVTSLAVSDEGVWVGCFHGLALYEDGKFRKYTPADGLSGNKISALKVIKGKLLVGTMDKGLSIKIRNLFVNVGMEKGLTDNRIEAIAEADEGAWVGTVNGLNLVEIR